MKYLSGTSLFSKRNSMVPLPTTLNIVHEEFKLFLKTYLVGNVKNNFNRLKLIKNDSVINLGVISFSRQLENSIYENSIDYFFSIKELSKEVENYKIRLDRWHELGFIMIGHFEMFDSILLGISENNYGQIWKYGDFLTLEPLIKLYDSFMDFIDAQTESLISDDDLQYFGIKLEKLIKRSDRLYEYPNSVDS